MNEEDFTDKHMVFISHDLNRSSKEVSISLEIDFNNRVRRSYILECSGVLMSYNRCSSHSMYDFAEPHEKNPLNSTRPQILISARDSHL